VPLPRLARAGDLPAVAVPAVAAAASRALTRARDDTSRALQSAKFRLQACGRRHAIRSTGRAPGGPAPLRWRAEGVCPPPTPHRVFQADVRAVTAHTARLPRLAHARHDPVTSWRWPPGVDALQARRRVPFPGAVTLGADMGALTRGETPRALMQCGGLIPSAEASGEPRRPGALTTAGHAQARSARVAGAWASRDPATGRRHLPLRRATPPQVSQDSRGKAQGRLGQRDRRRVSRGQHPHGGTGAMARELAGCRGAMAQPVPVTPSRPDA
jgi:transposase